MAAQETTTATSAWLHEANEYGRWPQSAQSEAHERAQALGRLIVTVRGIRSAPCAEAHYASASAGASGTPRSRPGRPCDGRMKKHQRLVRGSDFLRVRKQGRSWANPLLILAADANDVGHSRFGFIASRRVGGAVVRNRARRRMREALRRRLQEIPPGWDIVLIARPPLATARFADIEEALAQLLARARPWMLQRAAVKE